MLRNRALQVRLVPTAKAGTTSDSTDVVVMDPEKISLIASEFVTRTSVTVGIVYAGVKVVNTISQIAIIAAKAKLR
jgi:hypothetical protein